VAGPRIEPGTPALLVTEPPRPISQVNQQFSLSLKIPDEPPISVAIAKVKARNHLYMNQPAQINKDDQKF
jgi:hypothetical protein